MCLDVTWFYLLDVMLHRVSGQKKKNDEMDVWMNKKANSQIIIQQQAHVLISCFFPGHLCYCDI